MQKHPEYFEYISGIIECSPDLVALLDTDFKVDTMNSALTSELETIYGKNISAGESILSAMKDSPEEQETVKDLLSRALGGERIAVRLKLGRYGRLRKKYLLHVSGITGKHDNVIGLYFSIQDSIPEHNFELDILNIAEIEKERAAWKKNADSLLLAIHGAGSYIFYWDLIKNYVFRSDGVYNVLGFRPEEADHNTEWWLERIHPDDREREIYRCKAFIEGDDSYKIAEYRMEHKKGHYVPVWNCLHLIKDGQGNPVKVLGVVSDTTLTKEAQKVIKESENFLRNVLNSLFVLAGVLKPDGTLIQANQRALQIAGATADDLADRPFEEIGWWSDFPKERQKIRVAIETAGRGETARFDTEIVAGDGSVMIIDFQLKPMYDKTDSITHLIFSGTDITERKKAERALQEADQHKDTFLATLAHELRNPLGPISNTAEVLGHPDTSDDQRHKCVNVMKDQICIMMRLIDDLLDISRIRQGKVEFIKEQVQIGRIIERATEACSETLKIHEHKLTIKNPEPALVIEADFTRMTQVISNLLDNASKYTPDGGHIKICVKKNDEHVIIKVTDNGIGITKEMQPCIFDMFKQAGMNKGKTSGGSLGIGLALAKNYVEMHNGLITVTSKGEGLGSTFTVRLPLTDKTGTGAGNPVASNRKIGKAVKAF